MHHGDVSPEIAKGLLWLKDRIKREKIPPSKLDETVNIAIWNIREFGKKKRTEAAIHYIAEILGQFDLVAIVELRDNLDDLARCLQFLGSTYDVIYSDWIKDAGGNRERIAFLHDKRAVQFCGLAAEVDAPRAKEAKEYLATQSFWRVPYMCGFRSGNFDFIVIATHTRWGDDITARAAELELLAMWIDDRFKGKYAEDTDLIVMGDFNTPGYEDITFKALTKKGLKVPEGLEELTSGEVVVAGSNLNLDKRYDQILHLPTNKKRFNNVGGIVDFDHGGEGNKNLFPGKGYTKLEYTFQMSDHFPLWTQINVDIDGDRLTQIIQNNRK